MNSRERVEAAFTRKKSDRIPVNHRGFSGRITRLLLGREAYAGGSIHRWMEATSLFEGWHDEFVERAFNDAWEIARLTHQDYIRISYWGHGQKPTRKLDESTYLFEYGPEKDWTVMHFSPENEDTIVCPYRQREITIEDLRQKVKEMETAAAGYEPDPAMFEQELKALKLYGKDYAIEGGGAGIGIPHDETLGAWLEAMVMEPQLVHDLIALQVEFGKKNLELAAKLGFRYQAGGGDFCSERGPMYSPAMFKKFILPGLKQLCSTAHEHQTYFMFASDGNLWPVADYIFGESGVDAYFEIDRKAGMDLALLRQKFPTLTLLGGISSWTLACGGVDQVREEVRSCCDAAKTYGGIIVGVSNAIQPETPDDNIFAMIETIETCRI